MLVAALRETPEGQRPLEAIREAAVTVCDSIPTDDMIALDRLMRESEAVQARKQARAEWSRRRRCSAALRERWPNPARKVGSSIFGVADAARETSRTFMEVRALHPCQAGWWAIKSGSSEYGGSYASRPWHFFHFLPLPQGHLSFLPIFFLACAPAIRLRCSAPPCARRRSISAVESPKRVTLRR